MAKRTISFGSYKEPTWEEYTGEQPLPNRWYTGVVKRASYVADRDQMMFIIEITEGEFAGWGKPWYAPLEEGDSVFWKTQEIIRALQGGKQTDVSLDWENQAAVDNWLKKAKPIKFKTELYNEDIKVRKVAPLLNAVGGTAAPAPAAKEAELSDDADAGDEPLEDYSEEELEEMESADLEEILTEELDGELPKKPARDRDGSKYKSALIDAILEAQDDNEEEDAAEDGNAEPDADADFEDGFEEDVEEDPVDEPVPAKPVRRTRATKAAAPAPAKAAAPARRRR